jgi:glycosyltransferase involved in cell wall biosynthesis
MHELHLDLFELNNHFVEYNDVKSIEVTKSDIDFIPRYTIAIPTFKRGKLLKETIESAINQEDFNDFDIIIVDNDPERYCFTENLVKSINNKRISYFKNSENLGMTGNWNRLFELAVGDYIVMLHDDDLLYPNYLSKINHIQKKTNFNLDAIYVKYHYFDSNDSKKLPLQTINKYTKYVHLNYSDFALSNLIGAPVGTCFKRDKVLQIGGFDDSFYPSLDYAFYVKFSYFFKSIILLNNELSIYRIHENESKNKKTVLGFIEKDRIIKYNIISKYFTKWFKKPFLFYYEFNDIIYLKKIKNLYRIDDEFSIDRRANFKFLKLINFKALNKIWALKLKLKQREI